MKNIQGPQWVNRYCIEKESLSDCVDRWKYSYRKEYGYIYICKPYPGIHLWVNDVYMHSIPTDTSEDYHFVKLNYCMEGRCEILLEDDKYVYLEKDNLSIDSNAPKENFLFPGGRYKGLELILDMNELVHRPIQALNDCGIDPKKLKESLKPVQGSYLALVSAEWKELAEFIAGRLQEADGRIEDFRFYTLQLLYLLGKGSMLPIEKKFYVTKGQRMIVTKVEEKISSNLKEHYTVRALAEEYKISPSSLKKYFEQVYGKPISRYLREKRMEQACRMLAETRDSVGDIAAEAGYGNQGKFSSAFKKYTKKTPLEYRRLHNVSNMTGKEQT